ncbi:MAG: bifunctional riboflavin kinase/FAD synthetase [Porticoccaceae bacterium]|nr:bifunctional riboflavin kinase/FAD synthetase [Porticoccaceae bacterium]MEA3299860.1 bifunctional riboflavin kinase/FAD synthetase [Pseudomonadota bacterium]HLS98408.1 bifunctional riboflavin kinase/FAD synthetase [Porticoccaceae bacterium]
MVQTFIRGLHNLRPDARGVVATIGTFDGIHLGHQAIMAQVRRRAEDYGLPSMAMIFEPHPMEFFSQEQAPARLMRLHEKLEAIYAEGIERIFCLQFNRRFRQLSASEFIERVLIDGLGIRCLVVGDDFRFGCDRRGDSRMLKAAGLAHGFEVIDTATVVRDGRRVSSTWVREELEAGNFPAAQALLGKPFRISGRVVHGQRLGRTLGVPTANVHLHRYRAPLSGVFVVEVLVDGQRLPAVANVGVRPTVGDLVKPILEVHLLDWQGNLYGRRITVEFIDRIRDERQFANVDELLTRIRADIEHARGYFSLGSG